MYVIICERRPFWALRLSHFLSLKVSVSIPWQLVVADTEVRVFDLLANVPTAVVCWIAECQQGKSLVGAVKRQRREFPESLPVVFGAIIDSPWQPLVALAGAAWMGQQVNCLSAVVRLIERHYAMVERPKTLWWNRALPLLPWQEVPDR